MKNQKGFIGLIAILVVVVLAVFWMAYIMKTNWLGTADTNLSNSISGAGTDASPQSKDINGQLDDLRQNVKKIQDNKDKEIYDAMGAK